MAVQTVVGLAGIVVLAGVVMAGVAIWRTGSPFPPPRVARPLGPDCARCGHSDHDGWRCSVRVSASGDIYDSGGDWVGYRDGTYCNGNAYGTKPWPPCTTCGHGQGEHDLLLRCSRLDRP